MIVHDEKGNLLIASLNEKELEVLKTLTKDEVNDIIASPNFEPKPGIVERYSKKSPYHLNEIAKGTLGEISKIEEELAELKDAEFQGQKIMAMIELSDLYGAIEFYAEKLGITMDDLKKFSDLNKQVKSGTVH